MFSSGKGSKEPLLFDIRLDSIDNSVNSNGVIIINGNPETAPSIFLSGKIVLSISEPIQIKGVHLTLDGKIRLNIPNLKTPPIQSKNDGVTKEYRYNKFERRIYSHSWDNINIQSYFGNLYNHYGKKDHVISSTMNSSVGKPIAKPRSKSNASLTSLSTSTSGNSYCTLLQGNYEFPFSAILPGSLTESVEGFPNGCVRYTLRASIERSRNENDLICEKNIKIVRTLSPDVVELSETVSVQNQWPNKVDYDISVHSKAIAIGSTVPIRIHLIPILKGIRLGPIRISLVESSQYCGSQGSVIHQERIIKKIRVKDPLGHVNIFQKKLQGIPLTDSELLNEQSEFQDEWDITSEFPIPSSLSQCTQDCNILKNIKIRHKFKLNISLMNPDGHVSELRASVPVQLYISTFIPLSINKTNIYEPGHIFVEGAPVDESLKNKPLKIPKSLIEDDDIIFGNNESELAEMNNNLVDILSENTHSSSQHTISSMMAPPKYEKHNSTLSLSSPFASPSIEQSNTFNKDRESLLLLSDESHLEQLNYHLEKLHFEREKSGDSLTSKFNPFKSINISDIDVHITTPEVFITRDTDDHFSGVNNSYLSEISRDSSFITQTSSPKKDWDTNTLSRVPSYDRAMKNHGSTADDLPPTYPTEFTLDQPITVLERPQEVRHRGLSTTSVNIIPRGGGSRGGLNKSNNSSSTSLNNLTRTSSVSSFTLPLFRSSTSAKTNTVTKQYGFGMTPYEVENGNGGGLKHTASRGQLQNRTRTGSLNSIVDFFSK